MFEISFRHLNRYREIIGILLRHGLGYFVFDPESLSNMFSPATVEGLSTRNLSLVGQHLREACSELGPTFIKIGQLASTRSDLLPKQITHELTKLQDRAYPIPFPGIRQVVEESLGQRLESVFNEFQTIPLAAASVSQTHYAVLKSGTPVVVKVQRPGIEGVVQTDLEIFQHLISLLEQRFAWSHKYPLRLMLEEFAHTISEELNFLNEGRNAEGLAQASAKDLLIVIPRIYWDYSRRQVLTMDHLPGTPLNLILDRPTSSSSGLPSSELPFSELPSSELPPIAGHLSRALLKQILLDGFFHGDPHPGNMLILADGKIGLIDFGIMGRLSRTQRYQLAALVLNLVRGRNLQIVKVIKQMGITPADLDQPALVQDISDLRRKHLNGAAQRMIGQALQDFFDMLYRHRIYIPSQFIMVGKTLLTLEGVLQKLDPSLVLVKQAIPYARALFREKYGLKNMLLKLRSLWRK